MVTQHRTPQKKQKYLIKARALLHNFKATITQEFAQAVGLGRRADAVFVAKIVNFHFHQYLGDYFEATPTVTESQHKSPYHYRYAFKYVEQLMNYNFNDAFSPNQVFYIPPSATIITFGMYTQCHNVTTPVKSPPPPTVVPGEEAEEQEEEEQVATNLHISPLPTTDELLPHEQPYNNDLLNPYMTYHLEQMYTTMYAFQRLVNRFVETPDRIQYYNPYPPSVPNTNANVVFEATTPDGIAFSQRNERNVAVVEEKENANKKQKKRTLRSNTTTTTT